MNNQTNTQTVTLNLTLPQLEALRLFLERTDMRGYEVPKFLDLAQALRASVAPTAPSPAPEVSFSKNEVEAKG